MQWMRPKQKGKGYDYEFRGVTCEDLKRERIVEEFIAEYLARKLETSRPDEASAARILRELVRHQRLG